MSRFCGFDIPEWFQPTPEVAALFKQRAPLFERGPADEAFSGVCPDLRTTTLLPCGASCAGVSCYRCMNNLKYTRSQELNDIARFEALEWWLRIHGLLDGYHRPVLEYRGLRIPDNIHRNTGAVIRVRGMADDAIDYFCTTFTSGALPCGSATGSGNVCCDNCIYCNNEPDAAETPARQRLQIFREYVRACGYSLDPEDRVVDEGAGDSVSGTTATTATTTVLNHVQAIHFNTTEETSGVPEPLVPGVPPPDNIPPCTDFRTVLDRFNRGFTTWCDLRTTRCTHHADINACAHCGLFCTHAEEFDRWAHANGWETTRSNVQDVYVAPDQLPAAVNYTMTYDKMDRPDICPCLQSGDLVQLDITIALVGGITTRWLLVWGPRRPADDGFRGRYSCISIEPGNSTPRLGFAYVLDRDDDFADFRIGVEHIELIRRMADDCGNYPFINYANLHEMLLRGAGPGVIGRLWIRDN